MFRIKSGLAEEHPEQKPYDGRRKGDSEVLDDESAIAATDKIVECESQADKSEDESEVVAVVSCLFALQYEFRNKPDQTGIYNQEYAGNEDAGGDIPKASYFGGSVDTDIEERDGQESEREYCQEQQCVRLRT